LSYFFLYILFSYFAIDLIFRTYLLSIAQYHMDLYKNLTKTSFYIILTAQFFEKISAATFLSFMR